MDTNLKPIKEGFNPLRKNFENRYKRSEDKANLLSREIEAHELLFDDKKLPVWTHSNNRPLAYLNLNAYTDGDIIGIREAYIKYIVNGADINDTGKYFVVRKESINKDEDDWYIDEKGRFCKKMPPTLFQEHYYRQAKIRYLYLNWLKSYDTEEDKQHKDKNNLSLQELALISFYEGKIITRDKGKLYEWFLYYSKKENRRGIDTTRKKTENKIKRIEKIIPYLSISKKLAATDEVNTLKAALDKEVF